MPDGANPFTGTGHANDCDGYKAGAVGFDRLERAAHANVAYGTQVRKHARGRGGQRRAGRRLQRGSALRRHRADTFRFTGVRDSGDTIADFVHGTDEIDLSHLKAGASEYHFTSPFDAARFGTGHDLIWSYDGCNTIVLGDTGAIPNTAAFVLTLAGRLHLSASDFLL